MSGFLKRHSQMGGHIPSSEHDDFHQDSVLIFELRIRCLMAMMVPVIMRTHPIQRMLMPGKIIAFMITNSLRLDFFSAIDNSSFPVEGSILVKVNFSPRESTRASFENTCMSWMMKTGSARYSFLFTS